MGVNSIPKPNQINFENDMVLSGLIFVCGAKNRKDSKHCYSYDIKQDKWYAKGYQQLYTTPLQFPAYKVIIGSLRTS